MSELHLDLTQPLEQRISQFKSDEEKMREVNGFINDILEKARVEAENRAEQLQPGRSRLDSLGFQNGSKRIGIWSTKAKTATRTFASRVFTAICNCTNTVKSAVAANRN